MIYDWQKQAFVESDGQFLLEVGGYFETLKIENQRLVNVTGHMNRLIRGLLAKGYSHIPDFQDFMRDVSQLLKCEVVRPFNVMKFVYFPKTDEIYLQFRFLAYDQADYIEGVRVKVADEVRVLTKDAEYKATDRKRAISLREAAKQNGYYEVLYQAEHDLLIEGTVSNVFMVQKDIIYTPPLHGILNGTMRERLFQLFPEMIEERGIKRSELPLYDGCFITNALIGVMPVKEIHWDGVIYSYDVTSVHTIKDKIKAKD